MGYSTSTSDINDFHWEDELTAEGSQWMQYNNDFPSGTRFVAIQSYAQNTDLYLDDFLFEAYSSLARPTGLSVSELGDQRVTLKWNAPDEATDYIYQYRQENVSNWSSEASVNGTSVTLDGLTANTTYEFRVKARYDSGASNFVTFQFLTEGPMEAIPHYQDFENGMGGWRLENGSGRSGISTRAFHGGSHSFEFDEGSPEAQCLRSPLLEGNDAEKVVSFYFKNYVRRVNHLVCLFFPGGLVHADQSTFRLCRDLGDCSRSRAVGAFLATGTERRQIRHDQGQRPSGLALRG